MATRIVALRGGEWGEVVRASEHGEELSDLVVVDPGTAPFDPRPRDGRTGVHRVTIGARRDNLVRRAVARARAGAR